MTLFEAGIHPADRQRVREGITRRSPRTVELHRAQVMNRLNAGSLTELLQIALSAGVTGSRGEPGSSAAT